MKRPVQLLPLLALLWAITATAFAQTAVDYFNSGNAKQAQGDLMGTQRDYGKAIKLKPDYAEAYLQRGRAQHDESDYTYKFVVKDYTKAIELKPDYVEAYLYRAALEKLSREAESFYTKAIAIRPDDAGIYVARGLTREAQGSSAQAIEDFTKAVQLNPDFPLSYLLLARVKRAAGDAAGAAADAAKAGTRYTLDYVHSDRKWKHGLPARSDTFDSIAEFLQDNLVPKMKLNGFDRAVATDGAEGVCCKLTVEIIRVDMERIASMLSVIARVRFSDRTGKVVYSWEYRGSGTPPDVMESTRTFMQSGVDDLAANIAAELTAKTLRPLILR